MSEKDRISKRYLYVPERIADILNYYIFHGKQIVKAVHIRERKQEYFLVKQSSGNPKAKEVRRDIVVETEFNAKIVLIAIENQSDIHYAMPVRMLNGEAFWYDEQWKAIGKRHKEKKDLRGAEYISGFSKMDRLAPTLALCIYFGEEPWDGAKCLKDILDLEGMPREICELFMDYPLYLIEVNKLDNLELFQTDLRLVFGFLQRRKNKEALLTFVQENEEGFRNLPEDAFDFLCVMSNTKMLKEFKKSSEKEGGPWDMCQAIRELIRDEQRKGRRQGRRQGIQLARKVIYMNAEGKSHEDISKQCGISLKEVQYILQVPVA